MKQNNKRKGFTLVELLVVIAIIAILATVSVVGYVSFIDRAHQSNNDSELAQAKTLISADLLIDSVEYEVTYMGAEKAEGATISSGDVKYVLSLVDDVLVIQSYTSVSGTTYSDTADSSLSTALTVDKLLEAVWSDLVELPGEFSLDAEGHLVYTNNGVESVWK